MSISHLRVENILERTRFCIQFNGWLRMAPSLVLMHWQSLPGDSVLFSNRGSLSLPLQDDPHLLRRKDRQSILEFLTTEMPLPWALFCTIPVGQGPKDNSDKPSAEMTCDGSQSIQEANTAMAFS